MKFLLKNILFCLFLNRVQSTFLNEENKNREEVKNFVMQQVKDMNSIQDYMIHDVVILKFDKMKNFEIVDLCNDLMDLIVLKHENSIIVANGNEIDSLKFREGGLLIIVMDEYIPVKLK